MDSRHVYRVGRYVVDVEHRRVASNGSAIDLGWRYFEALRLLVEAQGGVVKKEQFFEHVWQGQFLDESNLTKCIAQLRKTLNNGGDEDYLETVPRVGYRLAVPVQPEPAAPAKLPTERTANWRWWAAGTALAALTSGAVWYAGAKPQRFTEAQAAWDEGRRLRRQKNPQTLGAAIDSFRKAIELNPKNAQYYGSLAEALTKVPRSTVLDPKLMLETAEKGVALDARCAGCNAVLGFILFSSFWDWKGAEQHLAAAIELNPKDSGSRGYYAMLLATQGRLDEALRQAETGIRLDAYNPTLYTIKSGVLYFLKRYAEASATADRAVSFGLAQTAAWDWRTCARLMAGEPAAAISGLARSGVNWYPPDLEAVFRAEGLAGAAQKVLQTMDSRKIPTQRAHWRMALGDRAGALDELEAAYGMKHFDLMYAAVDPMFEPLASEPRFRNLIEKMKLSRR